MFFVSGKDKSFITAIKIIVIYVSARVLYSYV